MMNIVPDRLVRDLHAALFYRAPDGAEVFRWASGRLTTADEPLLEGLADDLAGICISRLCDRCWHSSSVHPVGACEAPLCGCWEYLAERTSRT